MKKQKCIINSDGILDDNNVLSLHYKLFYNVI